MSNKTNEEKLRILKERLAQIKQKEESSSNSIKTENKDIETTESIEIPTKRKKRFYSSLPVKIILLAVIAYSISYTYNNIKNPIVDKEDPNKTNSTEEVLTYSLDLEGHNIAITETYDEESSAKAIVNDLRVKGFKANYFYLPNKSNSNQEVYKVFIGPYENEKETNQWIENLDKEISIINLNDGSILRHIKSSAQIQMEKENAEKEKIAKQREEEARIAKEKEEARIAKEKEEARIAKEKEEKERLRLEEIKKIKKENIEELKKEGKIAITYTYNFTLTNDNEGFLSINNNAGYPRIKQIFTDISSKNGVEMIVKNTKAIMESKGVKLDDISFEKSGTIVTFYKGDLKNVLVNN